MVRSESADESRLMLDDLEDDFDVEGGDETNGGRVRPWSDANGRPMGGSASVSPSGTEKTGNVDLDRRIRRQIANCNERRRMQSINAGFQSLRALLPRKEGEKLSKAAILQQTADLIQSLRAERARFLEGSGGSSEEDTKPVVGSSPSVVWKKPRLERESDSFDSIPSSSSSNTPTSTVTPSIDPSLIAELQNQLEKERVMRVYYENKLRAINSASCTPSSTPLSPVTALAGLPLGLQGASLLDRSPLLGGPSLPSDSVIRPTPTQPLRVDVSLANLVTLSNASIMSSNAAAVDVSATRSPLGVAVAGAPLPLQPNNPLAHRSLNVILEAIRHLEGGAFANSASSPPPTSHANLLVR